MGDVKKTECWGNSWGRSHKYRARYDEKWTGPKWLEDNVSMQAEALRHPNLKNLTWGGIEGSAQKDHTKTYVHDVCVRCGLVVKRQ